jgi:aminoglycoside phosphotransferase (APT) family kinase protein
MTDTADIERGVAAVLIDQGHPVVGVTVTGVASVGAQRSTVFVDLDDGRGVRPAVVQLAGTVSTPLPLVVEADCLRLAARAGLPVPEVLAAGVDPIHLDGPVLVTRRVDGVTVPRHVLRKVEADPALGPRLAHQCGEALARLHAGPVERLAEDVPRLTDPTPTEAYLAHLAELLDDLPGAHPALTLGLRWLERHQPDPPPAPALVHGDVRNGNLVVDDDGLAAVLDWELAHVGDPAEDLAWLCLRTWRFRNDHLEVGGFARLADLRTGYEAAGGVWRSEAFDWWKVARTLWWGIGLARQAAAFTSGATTNLVLAASGRRVAELEWDLLGLIGPTDPPT